MPCTATFFAGGRRNPMELSTDMPAGNRSARVDQPGTRSVRACRFVVRCLRWPPRGSGSGSATGRWPAGYRYAARCAYRYGQTDTAVHGPESPCGATFFAGGRRNPMELLTNLRAGNRSASASGELLGGGCEYAFADERRPGANPPARDGLLAYAQRPGDVAVTRAVQAQQRN